VLDPVTPAGTPAEKAVAGTSAQPVILALDTAGSCCSVAVAAGQDIVALMSRPMRHGHAEALLPMIDEVMREAALSPAALDMVAATVGPGGFTGIRVGLAAARGIALATGVPLVGITGFAAVAEACPDDLDGAEALLVALDSRRADFYLALFDGDRRMRGEPASVLPGAVPGWIEAAIGARPLLIAGDAAEALGATLGVWASALRIRPDSAPDARGVAGAARRRWHGEAGGLAGNPARPLYLRPPDVTLAAAKAPPPRRP
jgi:tRNA threonylcarbamoyladenosine biosynthesis protein TsaB